MVNSELIPISEIIPYENNPRNNEKAVEIVMKSIKEYGFLVPIILDKNNVIIAGHTRYLAAQKLGLLEVPVIWAENLTDNQVKAFRIMENKSHEYANWNYGTLKTELADLKLANFSLDLTGFTEFEINKIEMLNNIPPLNKKVDENLKTTHQCPNCHYTW